MTDTDHLIWSNYSLDYDDWKDDLEAEYPELSEDERQERMYEINGDYLDDERVNLNIQLSRPILVIADLGRWNGRFSGYKEIASGNIRDCLYSDTDYSTWYVDKLGDMRCDAIHHDGTNHYLYRTYKGRCERGADRPAERENLRWRCHPRRHHPCDGRRLGDEIGKVYGWDFPQSASRRKKWKDRRRLSRVTSEYGICAVRVSAARHHTGRKNAASSKTLEAVFHVKGADIRKTVNALRCGGIPCLQRYGGLLLRQHTGRSKYATIAQLNGRITKIANAKNGLLASTEMFRTPAICVDSASTFQCRGGLSMPSKYQIIVSRWRSTRPNDITLDAASLDAVSHYRRKQLQIPIQGSASHLTRRSRTPLPAPRSRPGTGLGRWVNKGTKGIALLVDKDTPYKLRHVFDVSDTNTAVPVTRTSPSGRCKTGMRKP
jgi:hypothetical protein